MTLIRHTPCKPDLKLDNLFCCSCSLICEVTRQMEVDLPWTHRTAIAWRFSLQRRKRKLLLQAVMPAVIILILIVILSIAGWSLLSLIPSDGSGSEQLAALRGSRVLIAVAGALSAFTAVYAQARRN